MADAATMAPQKRLRGLDVLRGVAALAVCLFHYTDSFPRETGIALPIAFHLGHAIHGVDMFLVISGFVIFMTIEKTRDAYDFLTVRVARLYPAFIACLLVTTAVVCLGGVTILKRASGSSSPTFRWCPTSSARTSSTASIGRSPTRHSSTSLPRP
jgi:peptidoglycan/LPS O-acetylase OafA/YrhL